MGSKKVQRIKSITQFHRTWGVTKPQHPLISLVDYQFIKHPLEGSSVNWVFDFYAISLKRNVTAKIKYGQREYDFDEGVMSFISPGQVLGIEPLNSGESGRSGYILLVHPDLLWNTPLAKNIRHYEYFGYAVNEALFLSDKEETALIGLFKDIEKEYQSNIDKFSQSVIVAQMELLLTYCDRYYHRQFLTRKIANHQVLARLEALLTEYFEGDDLATKGLPSVQYIADSLTISPNYLSGLLKVLTGQSTQQHIQDKVIEKAKERLSTTEMSVSEIAYELGFEHPQSFSKLFKAKTSLSPLEFRFSFN